MLFLKVEYPYKLLKILHRLILHLFNPSLGQPWTQVFHRLGYITLLLKWFQLWLLGIVLVGSHVLWHTPIMYLFLKSFLTFWHCKVLQTSHLILFPTPVLESAMPPRSPESFHWSGIRNQEPGTRYAHCYRGIIISWLSQQVGMIIYFKK